MVICTRKPWGQQLAVVWCISIHTRNTSWITCMQECIKNPMLHILDTRLRTYLCTHMILHDWGGKRAQCKSDTGLSAFVLLPDLSSCAWFGITTQKVSFATAGIQGVEAVAWGAQGCAGFSDQSSRARRSKRHEKTLSDAVPDVIFARPGGVEGTSFAPTRRELRGLLHSRKELNLRPVSLLLLLAALQSASQAVLSLT